MIKIQLDKSGVEALLTAEARAELHTIAREKVAEEIMRKVQKQDMSAIFEDAKKTQLAGFRSEAKALVDSFGSQWRFPAEAKALITKEIEERFKKSEDASIRRLEKARNDAIGVIEKVIAGVEAKIDTAIAEAEKKALDRIHVSLKADVKELARREFFDVLEQAKSGVQF